MPANEVAVLHGMGETRVITIPPMVAIIRDPCFQMFGYGAAVGFLISGKVVVAFGTALLAHLLRPDKSRVIELPQIPGVFRQEPPVGDPLRNPDGSLLDATTVGARV